MKHRIFFAVILAILLSTVRVFGQEVKKEETPQQKEVLAKYNETMKQLQDNLSKIVTPLKAQKYDLDRQVNYINQKIVEYENDYQKAKTDIDNQYQKLYEDAGKPTEAKPEKANK